jgi:hypothetical protein
MYTLHNHSHLFVMKTMTYRKSVLVIKYVSPFSTTFVLNTLHSDKYLVSYM